MKIIKQFQFFDLILQTLLLAGIILPGIAALFEGPEWLLFSMAGLLPFGAWQLFSALMLGLGLSDKIRVLYLLTAITFSSLFFSVGFLIEQLDLTISFELLEGAFIIGLFISFVAGIYYFSYSYRNYRSGNNQNFV